jgi:O-antigen/teichoic acid export membrane protein
MKPIRDLLKHSSIYGVGQILSRFASVLLLPLYTRCLSPGDYGCVAILDLTAGILAILIGAGMAQAVVRFHFDSKTDQERKSTWWTGIVWVGCSATMLCASMYFARGWLARMTLGEATPDGAMLYTLAIATLLFNSVSAVFEAYLAVKKWSLLYVVVSMGRLLLNIGLNVWFLVGLKWGVTGLLAGNLIAAGANLVVLGIFVCIDLGRPQVSKQVAKNLLLFGAPLIVTALLSLLMHEADRYFLRLFGDLGSVGVYSLAYKIGQAVNTLCLVPFAAIWNVVMYEIAQQPDARKTFARVFKYYVFGLLVVMLAASLFAYSLLPILTPGEFDKAMDLIPIVLLAFVFFALHSQFSMPALIAKKTTVLIPATCAGVAVNLLANFLLIPLMGAHGAAWSSVLTYAAFSLTGLYMYRRIERIDYPFLRCFGAFVGVAVSYLAVRFGIFPFATLAGQLGVSAFVCVLWTLVLFRSVLGPIAKIIEQKTGRRLAFGATRG